MDREDWRATIHGVAKSQTGLSTHTCISLRRFMYTLGNEYPKHHEEAPDADESLGGGRCNDLNSSGWHGCGWHSWARVGFCCCCLIGFWGFFFFGYATCRILVLHQGSKSSIQQRELRALPLDHQGSPRLGFLGEHV